MIEKALKYINSLVKPEIFDIEGEQYSDKPLHRISYEPRAEEIEMNTLSGLIDYIKSKVDEMSGRMILHVKSPTRVEFYSQLDYDRKREYIASVTAMVPEFSFGRFMDHEAFLIGVQSKFISSAGTDKDLLLKFAGTVESGTVANYGDDGVTQKATIKTGIASKGDALVPNPVILKPFRTFVEVDQPESSFIFRMKEEERTGIQCALFEADGGAWKLDAMNNIAGYLTEMLSDQTNITIIS